MFLKIYTGFGILLCMGLGAAFAMRVQAPNLGIVDGFGEGGGSGSGRGGFYSSSSGWSFGK